MGKDYPSNSERDQRSESDFPSELEQNSSVERDFPKEYQLHVDDDGNERAIRVEDDDNDVVSHIHDTDDIEEVSQYEPQTATCQTCRTCGETTEECGCETCRACGETTEGCGCETCRTCGEPSQACDCESCQACGEKSVACGCETCKTCGETTVDCGCDSVHQVNDYEEVAGDVAQVRDSINSFDQVARDIAQDLQVFDQVEDKDLRHLAGQLIPERNQDRLFSQAEEAPDESQAVSEIPEEEPVDVGPNTDEEESHSDCEVSESEEEEEEPEVRPRGAGTKKEKKERNDIEEELPEMPAPPSFIFRSERLSKNMADAMATVWDHFWAEDVKQIGAIIKNRFSQLMPYVRRFFAHIVAFWGGITYIRRALAAFIRILNRDERVRELLERVGWASTTTVRVFLSICAMMMQATLQTYYLVRNKIIPDIRRVVPIIYYKSVVGILNASKNSPWSLYFGPFSLTFAIDEDKVPDRYFLHNKLSVPEHDVSFNSGSVKSFVQSMRETIRTHTIQRSIYSSSNSTADQSRGSQQSTPVHTQSTDEVPYPAPETYTASTFSEGMPPNRRLSGRGKAVEKGHNKENYYAELARKTPLTERTNSQYAVRV